MVLKMPAIVGETQLSSLQHVVCNFPDGYCSEGLYTLNQTLNAFRLLPVPTRDSVLLPRSGSPTGSDPENALAN